MKKIGLFLLILASMLLLVACGGNKTGVDAPAGDEKESQAPTQAPNEEENVFDKIVFAVNEENIKASDEQDAEQLIAQLKEYYAGGSVTLTFGGSGNADIEAFVLKKGFVIQDAFSADVLVCTGSIEELDITFLKAAVSYEGVTELLVVPYESEQIDDGEFPVYLVGVFDEGNFVQIKNRTEFAKWLETLIERCQEGKAYGGIGVNMVGFEVGRSELTGIPYSHLSYSSDPIGTVLGLSYEVVAALDSKLIVDLLVLCPHFSRVEFYLTKDASKPVLTRG